ncbi:MAG: diguanylate cyclase, partial [Lysobacter sp.]
LSDVRENGSSDWFVDLSWMRRRYPALVTALVTDREGNIIAVQPASLSPPGIRPVDDREYFRVPAATGRPYASNAFRGRSMGTDPLIAVSAPLHRNGVFDGVIEGSIPVSTFTAFRGAGTHARGYEMLLIDRRSRVIYASEGLPHKFLEPVGGDFIPPAVAGAPRAQHGVYRLPNMLRDGGAAYVSHAPTRAGWSLYMFAPEAELIETARRRAKWLGLLVLLVSAGVLAASWRQMQLFSKGVGRLLKPLQDFALGAPPNSQHLRAMPEELQPLGSAIVDLSVRLNSAYIELSDALARQRSLTDELRDTVEQREREIAARTADLRHTMAELARLNQTDPLTGSLNVRGLNEAFKHLRSSQPGMPLAVLAIDVDHFKNYNDRYGHPAGDAALRRVVGAIQSVLRGDDDHCARTGGEEFVVLLPGADAETAHAVAQRIREHVHAADIPHAATPSGRLTVSIGVALSTGAEAAERVLGRADEALYRAKRDGRDRVAD